MKKTKYQQTNRQSRTALAFTLRRKLVQQVRVSIKAIVERKLLNEIRELKSGENIPVTIFTSKDNPSYILLILRPTSIGNIVELLNASIAEKHYSKSKLLCFFLLSKIRTYFSKRILYDLLNELKSIGNAHQLTSNREKETTPRLDSFKEIEIRVDNLLKEGNQEEAINTIDTALTRGSLNVRHKSALLLKKAQTFSSLNDYVNARKAYEDLIAFNEKHNKDARNLSHLHTELARLYAMEKDLMDKAIASAEKAIKYNERNTVASSLLSQLKSGAIIPSTEAQIVSTEEDEELIIETDEQSNTISKMIDIDIREHKYASDEIIRNGGKPSVLIAQSLFEKAKETTQVDLSERYPAYLEAAKAFSELPVGSYDYQDYLVSVAYYAILKGNSIYVNFRNLVNTSNIKDIDVLTRMRDCACSYYIESLNLLTNIPSNHLLTILKNFLKLNIALCNIKNNEPVNFGGQFKNVFFNCLTNDNVEYNEIAWSVIIEVGSASPGAWNSLVKIKGGTSGLYGSMRNPVRRKNIYELINKICISNIDTNLKPGEFLKSIFEFRRSRTNLFSSECSDILKSSLDVNILSSTIEEWNDINNYEDLLSKTDIESKVIVDKILKILSPYKNRNERERTNLLIQVQRIIEKQIGFINDNTTFYGRTLFFPLFTKWRKTIQVLLDKKIADSLPVLNVIADPPYIVSNGEKKCVNVLIKNTGDSTAEGCIIQTITSTQLSNKKETTNKEIHQEIPSGCKLDISLEVPFSFIDEKTISLNILISAIYQGKETEKRSYDFTLETEPDSVLKASDIPWNDSRLPKEQMFKGRKGIIEKLIRHYTSFEKDKPYILFGLTRTGKSSILEYLKRALNNKEIHTNDGQYEIITFTWELNVAASMGNAQDMWQYLLYTQIYSFFNKYFGTDHFKELSFGERPRAKDFSILLNYIKKKQCYPLILVDEFSFIKIMMDKNMVNPAFLHTLRQYSLEGLASFVFAGTYDIKQLIKDPKYGITGQLVNAVDERVNEIDSSAAEELINVIDNKLHFTNEAVQHIHKLSGDIPYFIQMICKYCGYYAVEKKRSIIGYPELEYVVKVLTGEIVGENESMVRTLPENVFQNNMYSPADPKEVNVLITSITYFNKDNKENARGTSMVELQKLWADKGILSFRSKLAEAIELLLEKKVLLPYEDEGLPVYKISVDLFRRWWGQHHTDITREIDTIL